MQRFSLGLLVWLTLTLQCCNRKREVEFDRGLADELKEMTIIDQVAAAGPQGDYRSWPSDKWNSFTDSVFTTNKLRLEEIFNQHGFPGFDLVGKEGSHAFWLIAQHCDNDVDFQSKILERLKIEVDKRNASPADYAYLVDRVKINKGEKQIYGTQVAYMEDGTPYPKPLLDSLTVNQRRREVGLESIEQYINMMQLINSALKNGEFHGGAITIPDSIEDSDSVNLLKRE